MLRRILLLLLAVGGLLAIQMGSVAQVAPPAPPPVPAPVPDAEADNTTLRIAFASNEAPSLDPHAVQTPLSFRLIATGYETLYMYTPGPAPRIVPCLAKDFPKVSEDGLTVTIKIDTAAKFHPSICFGDARTRNVKASDFVHSLKRLAVYGDNGMYWMAHGLIVGLDKYAEKARYNMEYETTETEVEGLKATDDETVVIKLTRPYAPIVSLFAHPSFSVIAREAIDTYAGGLRSRVVGTGPYRLNAVADSQLYVFKRWDGFRGEKPALDRVMFTMRSFWSEFVQGYTKGELHQIPLWPAYYDRVVEDGKPAGELKDTASEILTPEEHGYYFLSFNMEDELWGGMDADGRALRRAVALSVDRKTLLTDAGMDLDWSSPHEDVFPIGTEFEDTGKNLKFGTFDPDLAKKTLDGSKYKGGIDPATGEPITLTVLTTEVAFYDQIAATVRAGIAKLGMKLNIEYVGDDDYRERVNKADQHLFNGGWFIDYPDPVNFLQLFWSGNSANGLEFNNAARYKSAEFDKHFAEFEKLQPTDQNQQRRRELTAAMAGEIAKDQPIIPLIRRRTTYVRSTNWEWPNMPRQTYNDIRFVKGKN